MIGIIDSEKKPYAIVVWKTKTGEFKSRTNCDSPSELKDVLQRSLTVGDYYNQFDPLVITPEILNQVKKSVNLQNAS